MDDVNYKNVFENSAAMELIVDNSFIIVSISDGYLDLIKTTRKNISGNYIFDIFNIDLVNIQADSINKILDSLKQVVQSKLPDNKLINILYQDQNPKLKTGLPELRYWKITHSPLFDEFKQVKYIVQHIEDITKTEIATAQLIKKEKDFKHIEESEKRYNMLLLHSPFAFAILKGKEMVIMLANNTVKNIWGKGQNIEGKPLLEILPELKNTQFPILLNQVFITGIPFYGNQMLAQLVQNNKLCDVYSNFIYQPYHEADGTISGVTIIADDITNMVIDRKKTIEKEFRYRSLIEESTVAIALYIGSEIRINYVNDIMLSYWGKHKEDVLNMTFSDALPELNDHHFLTHLQMVYKTGIPYSGIEERRSSVILNGLRTFYFSYTFKAMRDKEGIIYGIYHMAIDITNEVISKNKLQESEERYKSLTKATSAIVWVTNSKGEFFEPQIPWQEYTGQQWEAHRKWGWINMIQKEDRKQVINAWKLAITKNYRCNITGRLWSQSHQGYRYFDWVGISFLDKKGKVKEWVGTITDVHEQQIANSKIAASEERFRLLILQAPIAICVLRGENYIIDTINIKMAEMWDRKIEELLNRPALEVLTELKELGSIALLDQVFTTGERFIAQEVSLNLKRKGKTENIFIQFIYEPLLDAVGKIMGVMAVIHDISAQVLARKGIEESENKFRLLTNTMPQKINTADAQGNVTYYNQKWLDDTGFSFEDLKNWGWSKAMSPADIEKTTLNWKRSLETGNPFEMEYRLLEKGVYKWNLSRALPLKDEKGKVIMWVGTHTDIQHIKEEQEQKDNFIGKVSHELRTPVTIIKTYTQLLQEILMQKGNAEEVKILTKIIIQIQRLNNLIMGLLDVTRLNSGTFTISNTLLDFDKLAEATVGEIKSIAPKNKFIQHFSSGVFVYSDQERIVQVMTNILTNAIKYAPENVEIIIQTYVDKKEVILSIQDFGVGIAMEEQNNIFKQFHRISGPMQHTYPGLGLGLYIAAEIIKQLKGKIWVESELGNGSTFYVSLPILAT